MSKYVKSTFTFVKNNWVSVFLHVLIPAVLYTIFVNPTSSFDYIMKEISTMDMNNIFDIFIRINDGSRWNSWQYVVFYFALIVITLTIFGSYIGKIQNKMKYGRPLYTGIKGVFKRTNENLWAAARAGIVMILFMELFAIAMSIVLFFAVKVTHIAALRIMIVLLAGLILIAGSFYGLAWVSCALPGMTMRRQGLFKAISESTRMVGNKSGIIYLDLILPLVITYIPVLVVSGFDVVYDHVILYIFKLVTSFIFYGINFMYFIPYMYCLFFDLNDIEREDLLSNSKWGL